MWLLGDAGVSSDSSGAGWRCQACQLENAGLDPEVVGPRLCCTHWRHGCPCYTRYALPIHDVHAWVTPLMLGSPSQSFKDCKGCSDATLHCIIMMLATCNVACTHLQTVSGRRSYTSTIRYKQYLVHTTRCTCNIVRWVHGHTSGRLKGS